VTDVRTFDQDYRTTSITDHGTANIQYLSYGYDADNNPTSITDNVTAGNTQTLTYDLLDRLKSAIGTYGTISSITYDSNSNRLTYGATTYVTPGLNDRMSTAAGSAVTYISTGNVNGVGTSSMTYNQANQLATATVSGTKSTYTYDFLGIRNKIKTGTTPFQITQYDQSGNLLTETSAAATPVETDYAYLDGMPISAIQPAAATISALHTDNLGTVLRGTDSTKTIVYTANFNPNGAVTPTTTITMNLRYPGQHADSTGAYYNVARYYDPSTLSVRYWQVDPLGLAPGMNPFVYGNNNPFKFIDSMGLGDDTVTQNGTGNSQVASGFNVVNQVEGYIADCLKSLEYLTTLQANVDAGSAKRQWEAACGSGTASGDAYCAAHTKDYGEPLNTTHDTEGVVGPIIGPGGRK
jgi:RHS repeat-associated protein